MPEVTNIESAFADAIRATGLPVPDEIIADGKLRRFKTGGRGPSRNGWYRLHADGVPAGAFGCWRAGISETWCAKSSSDMSPTERQAHVERIRAMQAERQAEEQAMHAKAREEAQALWNGAQPAAPDHQYLTRKAVKPHGLRMHGGNLLLPCYDAEGELHSLQYIAGNGAKWYVTGGRVSGCMYAIGEVNDTVVIGEGFATCASIHEATGLPVVVARNAGNLRHVAKAIRAKHPHARVLVAADNDHATPGNPGMAKAAEASQAVGGIVVVPPFPELVDGRTDFNDLAIHHGADLVRQAFEQALKAPAQTEATKPRKPALPPFEAAEDDGVDRHRNAPRPDPACLYGLVGDVARAGAATTEANAYAIAANVLGYLGVCVGRGPFMYVGNTKHHARLFLMHVGRSGRGRKGDAVSLVSRVDMALRELAPDAAPQVHRGGLSSREGLAYLVHDGYREGKTEVDPVLDKRLLVVESEFANILHQSKREGNTLSPALRDCWDGVSIRPATKGNRMWATNPHVGMLAAVTPAELRDLMAQRELTNGFANRFGIFWAERERIIPFPRATPQEAVDGLAQRVLDVLRFCQAERWAERDHLRMELSPEARARYEVLYCGELNDDSAGERINALLERRAPMLLRIAMILALTDMTATIEAHHVDAALAWVRYFTDSVKFIFASAVEEEQTAKTNDAAEAIVKFLSERGRATRWELSRDCFKGHASKDELDTAIDLLLTATPPRIVIEMERGKGRPTKFYQLAAKKAEKAKNEQRRGFAADSTSREVCEVSEVTSKAASGVSSPLRILREDQKRPGSRVDTHSSPTSHSSPGSSEQAMEVGL